MASEVREIEVDGVKLILLEDFRSLYRILSAQPANSRWDVLAVDKYMTAEIVSLGNTVRLAMYAEVEAGKLPEQLPQDPDIMVEVEEDKIKLRFLDSYPFQGRTTLLAIVNKVNAFRRVLAQILSYASTQA